MLCRGQKPNNRGPNSTKAMFAAAGQLFQRLSKKGLLSRSGVLDFRPRIEVLHPCAGQPEWPSWPSRRLLRLRQGPSMKLRWLPWPWNWIPCDPSSRQRATQKPMLGSESQLHVLCFKCNVLVGRTCKGCPAAQSEKAALLHASWGLGSTPCGCAVLQGPHDGQQRALSDVAVCALRNALH